MSKKQKSDIESMISEFPAEETEEEASEEFEEEESEEEEFEEEESEEESEEEETEESDEDDESEEEESEEEEEEDESTLLRSQLNVMSKRLKEAGLSIESPKTDSSKSDEDEEDEELPPVVTDFITAEELEQLEEKPEMLNTILNRVYTRAREDTIKSIPQIVKQTTARQITLQNKVRDFYEENSDLLPHRDFVGFVASEIEDANSDKDLDWVFSEAAKEARKRLGLKHLAQSTEQKRKRKKVNPAFPSKPKGGRGYKKHDQRSGEQKQIDAVIDL